MSIVGGKERIRSMKIVSGDIIPNVSPVSKILCQLATGIFFNGLI